MEDIEDVIIVLYKKGHSIKSITNTIFRYSSGNIPVNYSFPNNYINDNKKYSKIDCYNYIARVIMQYNVSNRK